MFTAQDIIDAINAKRDFEPTGYVWAEFKRWMGDGSGEGSEHTTTNQEAENVTT